MKNTSNSKALFFTQKDATSCGNMMRFMVDLFKANWTNILPIEDTRCSYLFSAVQVHTTNILCFRKSNWAPYLIRPALMRGSQNYKNQSLSKAQSAHLIYLHMKYLLVFYYSPPTVKNFENWKIITFLKLRVTLASRSNAVNI